MSEFPFFGPCPEFTDVVPPRVCSGCGHENPEPRAQLCHGCRRELIKHRAEQHNNPWMRDGGGGGGR